MTVWVGRTPLISYETTIDGRRWEKRVLVYAPGARDYRHVVAKSNVDRFDFERRTSPRRGKRD